MNMTKKLESHKEASYLQHCSSSKSITLQSLYLRMSITFSTSTISLFAIVLVTWLNIIEPKLQQTIYKLEQWADLNGFKFSQEKIKVIHFCHKRKLHPDPELYLNKHPISVVKEIKFLGIVFDSKLNFKAHILYLRNKCLKSLNLKIIADKDWGADQKTPHFIQNTNSFQTRVWFLYLWFNSKVLPLSTKYRSYSSPPDLHWSIPNFSN